MDLVANNLSYKPDDQYHLNEVSFNFKEGNLYTILGRTLSGKTTLLKTIAGLLTPDSGDIEFDGKNFFFCWFILGIGMTVTAAYIFLAILLAPALISTGMNPLAVHMFIFYWGMLSFITPPVALGAFAAASVAPLSL